MNLRLVTCGPISTSVQQLEFLCCLLSSYLFSWIFHRFLLHSKRFAAKQFFTAVISHIYILICFSKTAFVHIYFPVLFTFYLAKNYRDKTWMSLVNFAVILGHLSFAHIHRQLYEEDLNYNVIDITAPLMMLVIKLSTFAFDIKDAIEAGKVTVFTKTRSKNSRSIDTDKHSQSADIETKTQRMLSLQQYPSLLEFLGYAFFFPGFLTGPVISFYEYRCFLDGSYCLDIGKRAQSGRKRRILRQLATGLFFLIIYALFKDIITLKSTLMPEHAAKPLWYRALYLHVANIIWRSKYYFAWIIAEGAYIMIGLGYRAPIHPDTEPRWDGCENVNVKRAELASNFKQVIGEWNLTTNRWLHNYVYLRYSNWQYSGARTGFKANLLTYVVSAFWHGFYPGYYLVFCSGALYTHLTRGTALFVAS